MHTVSLSKLFTNHTGSFHSTFAFKPIHILLSVIHHEQQGKSIGLLKVFKTPVRSAEVTKKSAGKVYAVTLDHQSE